MAVNQAPVGNPRQAALQISLQAATNTATHSKIQAAQDIPALRQVFQNIQADSCPHTYNFHMHTVCSDGQLQPEALMEQSIHLGLRGMAITDHHTVKGYKIAQQWLLDRFPEIYPEISSEKFPPNSPEDAPENPENPFPHLWTGVEITSRLIGTEVHILGYGFNPDHESLLPYLQGTAPQEEQAHASQVIRAIQQAGGLAILAHPARYRQPAEQVITAAAQLGIDGVETYYAYNNPNPWQTSPDQSQQVKDLSTLYNLLNTCGTDTHGLDLLRRI